MIAIIGRGNVASHLFRALQDKIEVVLVNPHTLEELPDNPEVILLAVKDDAIKEVASKINRPQALIAHTAGSVEMKELEGFSKEFGVFYPLQTFSKDVTLQYSEIPVFVEGSSPEKVKKLRDIAALFSAHVKEADSSSRKVLHLASVFACNFTNALALISKDLLEQSDIDFTVILPLMKQTVEKLNVMPPEKAQTGPAVRGDRGILYQHCRMLNSNPDIQQIYALLSELIQKRIVNKH